MPIGRHPYGFTYIGLLLFIAIAGIALSVIGPVWHAEAQREKEKELLFVGEQYARAIRSYLDSTPGDVKQFPASLQDLLEDKRFPVMRRHLRKIYPDPMTGSADWGLVKQQNRIVAVYSLAKSKPVKREGFKENMTGFAHAESYQDWQFSYAVATGVTGIAATGLAENSSTVETDHPKSADAGNLAASAPTSSTATPASQPAPRPSYANCAAAQSAENAQCRSGCGQLASAECRACFAASFANYRACLHGQ